MKNAVVILIFSLVIVSSIFALQAINLKQMTLRDSEDKKSSHGSVFEATTRLPEFQTTGARAQRIDYYDYILGTNLKFALSDVRSYKCSIILGVIQDIKPGEGNNLVKHVDFLVEDWMTGLRGESGNNLQLIFDTRVSSKADWNEKPFDNVRLERGQRLIISYCPARDYYRLVLSDQAYFQSVREVIAYDTLDFADETSDKIIDRIRSEKNLVFAGYIIERFSSMSTVGDVENRAKVLVELLDDPIVPKKDWGRMLAPLSEYLRRDNLLTSATQNELVRKLGELGGGDDDYQAQQSILFLIRLMRDEKIDFARFLNKEKTAKLNQNYKRLLKLKYSIIMSNSMPDERKKFEERLSQNH